MNFKGGRGVKTQIHERSHHQTHQISFHSVSKPGSLNYLKPHLKYTNQPLIMAPKVLIVLTSHSKLGDTDQPTGWFLVSYPPSHLNIQN